MSDDDEKPKSAKIIYWQLKRREYGEAVRSGFKLVPDDGTFDQLLKRLDEAERDQSKKKW